MKHPDSLILVYDGESGLRALVLDVLKKAAGREDCPLCEITYGPLGKRGAWKACEERLGIPIEELHRDSVPPAWRVALGELPCVLASVGDERPTVLVSRDAITACRGSAEALEERIRRALRDAPVATAADVESVRR